MMAFQSLILEGDYRENSDDLAVLHRLHHYYAECFVLLHPL